MMLDEVSRAKILGRNCLLYEGIKRNQKHIPALETNLCTHVFLQGVFDASVFVFDTVDVRMRNIVTAPSLVELQKLTTTAIKKAISTKNGVFPASESRVTNLLEHVE